MNWRVHGTLAVVCLIGCDASEVTRTPNGPASLEIASPDTMGFEEVATATAVALDEVGQLISVDGIEWSADERVISVNSSGSVTALRPGVGTLIARSGTLADSVLISVVTSNCQPPYAHPVDVSGNGFLGSFIYPGWMNRDISESGITNYNGTPTFYGAGVVFGVGPDSVMVGYHPDGPTSLDYRLHVSRVCRTSLAPMHTLARLEPNTSISPTPPFIPGLVVVQEQFAYGNNEDHGYVLFRYEFSNASASSIQNLYVGFISDFDVYSHLNVGAFDESTQTAYVMSPDSINQKVVAGTTLIGSDIFTYEMTPVGAPFPSRADYYGLLTNGMAATGPSEIKDVKHIVASAPMELAPGETKDVWFALVVGADRGHFQQNVEAAHLKVETLR